MFNTAILFFENASMGIITQRIEKITCRWDSTLNMVKYNHNMRLEVYSMKKLFKVFSLMLVVIMAFPFSVMASENDQQRSDLIGAEEEDFEKLIAEIQTLRLLTQITQKKCSCLFWKPIIKMWKEGL